MDIFIIKSIHDSKRIYNCLYYQPVNNTSLIKYSKQGRPLVSLALDSQIFSPGQTYVAISRCPTWDKVSISSIHRDAFITDPDVINEYRRLEGVASQKLPIV